MGKLNYFAYGSNMHPARLRRRVPSAEAMGVVNLSGYRLHFHKLGADGSGKCNIIRTHHTADSVHGVLYVMEAVHKPLLDEAEGEGYRVDTLAVAAARGELETFAYIAEAQYINDTLKPYGWYKELVLRGALTHRLPAPYVARIAAIEAIDDPDDSRTREHRSILDGVLDVRAF